MDSLEIARQRDAVRNKLARDRQAADQKHQAEANEAARQHQLTMRQGAEVAELCDRFARWASAIELPMQKVTAQGRRGKDAHLSGWLLGRYEWQSPPGPESSIGTTWKCRILVGKKGIVCVLHERVQVRVSNSELAKFCNGSIEQDIAKIEETYGVKFS